jgi:heme oxygenase
MSNDPKITQDTLLEILSKVYMRRLNYNQNLRNNMINFFGVPLYQLLKALPCGRRYTKRLKK